MEIIERKFRTVFREEIGNDCVAVLIVGDVTHDILDAMESYIGRRRSRMDARTEPAHCKTNDQK